MIAVQGRMYTMTNTSASTLIVGAFNGGPPELLAGDTINLYSPVGQPLGSVTLKSVTSVSQPAGFDPTTPNVVFGGDFEGYLWFQASPLCALSPGACGGSSQRRMLCWRLHRADGLRLALARRCAAAFSSRIQ